MAKKRYKCVCGKRYAKKRRMRRGKLTRRHYCCKPCMRHHERNEDARQQLELLHKTDLGADTRTITFMVRPTPIHYHYINVFDPNPKCLVKGCRLGETNE